MSPAKISAMHAVLNRRGLLVLGGVAAAFGIFLYLVNGILMPFVVGFMLAYLLNPLVSRMERWGLGRSFASIVPVLVAVVIIVGALAVGIPSLAQELGGFMMRLPVYVMALENFAIPHVEHLTGIKITADTVVGPLSTYGEQAGQWGMKILTHFLGGVQTFLTVVGLTVVTPVVAYYLLVDWGRMTDTLQALFPPAWRPHVDRITAGIDAKLAAYLRGTMALCATMGVYYATALTFIGLEMGWAIGLMTGLMIFLPMVGSTMGALTMLTVALMQYQTTTWVPYVLIAGTFALGQFLEGSVIGPKLVGKQVGLHPVWVMFAILAGGSLAGFVGMLLALPTAVIVTVLLPEVLAFAERVSRKE